MLYHLLKYLADHYSFIGDNLYESITFRSGIAFIFSLIISMIFGGKIIRKLHQLQVGETVRDLGLDGQLEKQGTPTMGGVIIVMAIIIPCLFMARLDNVYILLMLFTTLFLAAIGFTDDYIKVFRKNKEGLSGKAKILGQVIVGLVIALTMLYSDGVLVRMNLQEAQKAGYEVIKTFPSSLEGGEIVAHVKATLTNVPFIKDGRTDYTNWLWFLGDNAKSLVWIIFVPLVIFIVTAVSNAANLTDGLDGLATGV
ncbi:MAG: phospho-N-acetylmuramoyl-pentapeptide-transferase, partial [Bacteroidota bacterium]